MAPRKNAKAPSIYQIKITLKDVRPPIWRRVQVRSDELLEHLHYVIQLSMGWTNSHLHSFTIQGIEYGVPMPEFDADGFAPRDEKKIKLSKVISGEKFKFSYLYDFGDSWEHEILVEKILAGDPEIEYPLCIKAKRACPPEDCGGTWGYQEFLEAVQDPANPEHEEMLEWVGGTFDPENVELDEANQQLKLIDEWKRMAEMF
jgi:hypothetical protein